MPQKASRIILTAVGKDRPGLIAGLTSTVANIKGNIEDFDAVVLKGTIFVMSMVIDISQCDGGFEEVKRAVMRKGEELGLRVDIHDIESF